MTNQNKVEAVLFATGRAMEEATIAEITGLKPKETQTALQDVKKLYDEREGALFIWNEGTKWKINVREAYIPLIKTITAEAELDRPVLETLAVIAYRQPMIQSDVIKARGEGAYAHIAELVEKGFVTKEKYQRSFKLKLSERFYNYFDVEGDADIRELFKEVQEPDKEAISKKVLKRLGQLDVVNAKTDTQVNEEHRKQMQLQIFEIEKSREKDQGYLNKFEDRLDEVSARVSTTEQELNEQKNKYKPEEPEEDVAAEDIAETPVEETTEEEKQETPTAEKLEDTVKEEEPEKDIDPEELVKEIDQEIDEITKDYDKKQ